VQEALRHEAVDAIIGMHHGIQGFLAEDLVDLRKESLAVIEGLRRTPSAALGSCRYKLKPEDFDRILEICRAHKIRFFLYAGGGDSMDVVNKVCSLAAEKNYEMHVIGIPKTIDNDLACTDHSPGYGSAARFETITCSEVIRDTFSLRYTEVVKIIETMGRNSGWLTAACALAGDYSPDLIYVPERRFTQAGFLEDVEAVYRRKGYVVIAACEGLRKLDGSYVSINQDSINVDAFGHPEAGGLGQFLADLVVKELKLKSRVDKPGTMQRCSGLAMSDVDAQEAYHVGKSAVQAALQGESGCMVTLERQPGDPYRCVTGLVSLERVANMEKTLPDAFINEAGNFVTDSFLQYARPLIGADLPDYVTLAKNPLPKRLSPI
jgi:6-phosphofructokinase 1